MPRNLKFRYVVLNIKFIDVMGILSEMGPYGSICAHIKTGKSYMAQDHFKTPPDPKNGYEKIRKCKRIKKVDLMKNQI